MTESRQPAPGEIDPPEVMAARIRRSYKSFFYAPAICLAVAVGFAVGRDWLYAAVFAFSALVYFPLSLSQYRSSKIICEKAIRGYQEWALAKDDADKG